ncbi:MAG: DUF2971 domain-containing protein [Oscillospiraceae bacterium]|jgi:hypothetical protein|nr:DUF2971 domain-containing protein [Oscillospiraceae bacterium]
MVREREAIERASEKYDLAEWSQYGLNFAPNRFGKLISHTTTLETFYNIIKTDGFWATQARFSNDEEELKVIQKLWEANLYTDSYIVCFCGKDDLLSQWRGYCKDEEGVSISFDLSAWRQIYLKTESGDCSDAFYAISNNVLYAKKEVKERLQSIEEYFKEIPNINKGNRFSPYIKDPFFYEEREARLVVINEDRKHNEYIRYRASEKQQIPFAEIKMGNPKNIEKNCMIRCNVEDEIYTNLLTQFESYREYIINCRKPEIGKVYDDTTCFGCTMRSIKREDCLCQCSHKEQPTYISTELNCIFISEGNNQKEIFLKVAESVDMMNNETGLKKIKVWCEGHLPVRMIRVGNTRRKNELKEVIEHYCKYNNEYYWLTYVDVKTTKGPFRVPINFK